ncbi:HEAT repeat domain-containing protein [Beggiatoa leptomitoformis]|uniref:MFS transporter n=1 Tax=Beggiatoa leptomitoformis TaxID=288004 RepID=A0A2N9YC79_9GAMM|nr:HEAT repeat domain-containing protein [Beggiatoa leptomitoformis]ALG66628.1 MFS transporter [Beggiatoa leptomitoformis]AUI68059.1 MFS transporter [Beggiatoa leptomitoformis]
MLKNSLANALNIRGGEGLPLMLLLVHSFFKGISTVFFETTANTLFLKEFDSQYLPYVYMATAVLSISFGIIYSKLEAQLSPDKLLTYTISLLWVMLLFFYLSLSLFGEIQAVAPFFAITMMIWKGVHWILLTLEFWALAGLMFNVRQGKRLFGLTSTGDIIAIILGGASVSFLVKWIGTTNLLLISLIGVTGSLLILRYITHVFPKNFIITVEKDNNGEEISRKPLSELIKEPYVILFFIISAISSMGYYFVDFIFYDTVGAHYTHEEELAGFFGLFFALLGFINFISSALLSGRLLTRYGLTVGLLSLPVIVFITTGLSVSVGILNGTVGAFLWLVTLMKLFDEVLRTAFESPTFRILYQPFPVAERLRIQGVRESIVEPTAVGVAGILLLVCNLVFQLSALHLAMLFLIPLSAWILVAFLLRKNYTKVLMNALSNRKLNGLSLSLEDGSSVAVLQKGLESPLAGEVIYCLNTLEEMEHNNINSFFIKLLEHSQAEVRIHALRKIEQYNVTEAVKIVNQHLLIETNATALGTAIRTFCAISDAEAFEHVATYTNVSNPNIKKGAIVGLLKNGGIDGVLAAGETLNALLISPHAHERCLAADILGDVGITSFYRPLIKLLHDNDVCVRRAALSACSKLKNPKLLPLVLENLSHTDVRETAAATLVAFGDAALPVLEQGLHRQENNYPIQIRLLKVCARIGSHATITLLKSLLQSPPRREVYCQLLKSLVASGYRVQTASEEKQIEHFIEREVRQITLWLASIQDMGIDSITALLVQSLHNEIQKSQELIFFLLAFLHPAKSIFQAQRELLDDSTEKRAYALEALDNIISHDIKILIFPLLDNLSPAQRLARLTTLFPQTRKNRETRLREMLDSTYVSTTAWTKACTLFVVGKSPSTTLQAAVLTVLEQATDPLVRETAIWALAHLKPADLQVKLRPYMKDTSPHIIELIQSLLHPELSISLTHSSPI